MIPSMADWCPALPCPALPCPALPYDGCMVWGLEAVCHPCVRHNAEALPDIIALEAYAANAAANEMSLGISPSCIKTLLTLRISCRAGSQLG